MKKLVWSICGAWLTLSAGVAHAELWSYTDAQGVTHFSSEKVDVRYHRVLADDAIYDVARDPLDVMPAQSGGQRTPGSPLFGKMPGFQAVSGAMKKAADQHGVEFELLQALVAVESRFDALARNASGATGLMQLMPATARRYGLKPSDGQSVVEQLQDPETNLMIGARYLRDMLSRFPGRMDLALASYNAGLGNVLKFGGNRLPPYQETRNFVASVMQIYERLKGSDTRTASRD